MDFRFIARARRAGVLALGALVAMGPGIASPAGQAATLQPLISDWQFVSSGSAPPLESACNAVGRRCFNPAAMANSYNYAGLHASGTQGQGETIAIIDSFGSDTIASDLNNFSTQFSLQHLCGEAGYTCKPGDPTFKQLTVQGSPPTTPPPSNNSFGQENHNLWALEVSLDVEWAHATAPKANILLVTTPTAETLGVQGFPQMTNAIQQVVNNHMADVISMSLGAGEGSFQNGDAALQNMRSAFIDAQTNKVTVLASSGDGGTTNVMKEPVQNANCKACQAPIPYPSVIWPASDPLVTAVGGTYLCMNAQDDPAAAPLPGGTAIDSVSPPTACQNNPGQREVGWIDGGGGYSILFDRPAYQDTLPPGSSYVGSSAGAPGPNSNMRGVPDVAYQASSRTGALVYMTISNSTRAAGTGCGGASPCSSGWYTVGGTSASAPQWAGIVAMADQVTGHDLGFLNPALYTIAKNPAQYAADFYDVTVGSNQTSSIPGYSATIGWDAVTGLGTPNVAKLINDLKSF